MLLKNLVTPPGIDPGDEESGGRYKEEYVRLVEDAKKECKKTKMWTDELSD